GRARERGPPGAPGGRARGPPPRTGRGPPAVGMRVLSTPHPFPESRREDVRRRDRGRSRRLRGAQGAPRPASSPLRPLLRARRARLQARGGRRDHRVRLVRDPEGQASVRSLVAQPSGSAWQLRIGPAARLLRGKRIPLTLPKATLTVGLSYRPGPESLDFKRLFE